MKKLMAGFILLLFLCFVLVSVYGEQIKVKTILKSQNKLVTSGLNVNVQENPAGKKNVQAVMSNGRIYPVKIMPSVASERALNRLRIKVCSEKNDCTIELKEVPIGKEMKVAYHFKLKKEARVLGIFSALMETEAEVDAETGEVISVKKSWWSVFADEVDEEPLEEVGEETGATGFDDVEIIGG